MTPEILVVASAANERYATGLGVMMCSVLLCTRAPLVRFHIMDDGISPESKSFIGARVQDVARARGCEVELNFINFKAIQLPPLQDYYGSMSAYGRIYLPRLVNDPSLFYVDADIICDRDFPTLHEMTVRHPEALLAACVNGAESTMKLKDDCPWIDDLPEAERDQPYMNSGFMWMNLEGLRQFGIEARFSELAARGKPMRFADQTALNFLCRGRLALLPGSFNVMTTRVPAIQEADSNCNLHFTGTEKPWNRRLTLDSYPHIFYYRVATDHFGFSVRMLTKGNVHRWRALILIALRIRWMLLKLVHSEQEPVAARSIKRMRLMTSRAIKYQSRLASRFPRLMSE